MGIFYIQPQSNNEVWIRIECSVDYAVKDDSCDKVILIQ